MRVRPCAVAAAAAAALLVPAAAAPGQALSGRVVLTPSRTPAAGAAVVLVGDSARVIGETRTDSTGVFAFQADRPGSYRLLVFRASARSVVTPPFQLDSAAELQREFHVPGDGVVNAPVFLRGDVDKPAGPAGGRAPRYPNALASRGVRGLVRVLFVVDGRGRVDERSLQVLGATDEAFAKSVRSVLDGGMKFVAAEREGRPVAYLVRLTFDFGCPGDPEVGDVIVRTMIVGGAGGCARP